MESQFMVLYVGWDREIMAGIFISLVNIMADVKILDLILPWSDILTQVQMKCLDTMEI